MPIKLNGFDFTDETVDKFRRLAKGFNKDFGESISEQLAKEQEKRKKIQFQEFIELKRGFEEMAKISRVFYDGLLKQGFSENEALRLTSMFISNLVK